jgi:hypothetical protein
MANPTGPAKNKTEERTTTPGTGAYGSEKTRTPDTTGYVDKFREGATAVGDKAREAMSTAADKGREAMSTAGQRAEDATGAVASGMQTLAGTIREKAPQSGFLGSTSSSVADTLERGGRYLEEQGLSGIGDDLTNLIRRNPVPSLLVGIALGFLVARATSSRS